MNIYRRCGNNIHTKHVDETLAQTAIILMDRQWWCRCGCSINILNPVLDLLDYFEVSVSKINCLNELWWKIHMAVVNGRMQSYVCHHQLIVAEEIDSEAPSYNIPPTNYLSSRGSGKRDRSNRTWSRRRHISPHSPCLSSGLKSHVIGGAANSFEPRNFRQK